MWVAYALKQAFGYLFTLMRMVPLLWRNHFCTQHLPTQGASPTITISLTTHGKRIERVFYAIESLSRSNVPIVLWLDESDYNAPWPRSIQRLVARGLQVRCSDGQYGPHTKYWNQFREVAGSTGWVVTADDDIIYPEWFIERLRFIASLRNDCVIAYRAHRIELTRGRIAPYLRWTPVNTCRASVLHFATGVSGVLYPPSFISYVVEQGEAFQQVSPRADDVWLHLCALRSGHPIRQVFSRPRNFAVVPRTQSGGLALGNTFMGGNDEQIRKAYTQDDFNLLLRASQEED